LVESEPNDAGQVTYAFQHSFGGPAQDGTCVNCHVDGGVAGGTAENHLQGAKETRLIAEEQFDYEIISIENATAGETPVITFAVNNPTDDSRYDINADAPFTAAGASLTLNIAWNTSDYSNEGSGSDAGGAPAQPVALNLAYLKANATQNADGSYTVAAAAPLPASATGGVAVAMEGHPTVAVPSTGEPANIPVDGTTAFAGDERRDIVAIESCNNCHEFLSLHGSNRSNDEQLCATCHNPDATDIRRRTGAGVTWASPAELDGKGEESVHLKYMVHAIHAAGTVVYGFGNTAHDYRHITYPQEVSRCDTCHLEGTYYPVPADARPTTVGTGASLADWRDDEAITPTAAACWSCHQTAPDFIAVPTKAHIEQNGGYIPDGDPATPATFSKEDIVAGGNSAVIEACGLCHGPGGVADVQEVHGLAE
jgi:OmcA/MtrC family decaheme c-type cytochrome